MFVLELYQEGRSTDIGIFKSIDEGRKFLKKIPAYKTEKEDGFMYEYIDWNEMPDYMEVEFNGNVIPFTRFMFTDGPRVDAYWKEIPDLSEKGDGIFKGATRVDAYSINNEELKAYIEKREKNFVIAKEYLEKNGYQVDRAYLGSEDGEAIIYKKKASDDWHFLTHMDPGFVEEDEIVNYISEMMNEM